jgi:hypothetical protein
MVTIVLSDQTAMPAAFTLDGAICRLNMGTPRLAQCHTAFLDAGFFAFRESGFYHVTGLETNNLFLSGLVASWDS